VRKASPSSRMGRGAVDCGPQGSAGRRMTRGCAAIARVTISTDPEELRPPPARVGTRSELDRQQNRYGPKPSRISLPKSGPWSQGNEKARGLEWPRGRTEI